jgi:hypothetical protein
VKIAAAVALRRATPRQEDYVDQPAGVRYDKWIRFMFPLMGILLVASLVMLGVAAAVE